MFGYQTSDIAETIQHFAEHLCFLKTNIKRFFFIKIIYFNLTL